jgi:hypothetical protein
LSRYYSDDARDDLYRQNRAKTPADRVREAGASVADMCFDVTVQDVSSPSIVASGLPNLAGSWRVPEDDRARVRAAWFKITDSRSALRHREGVCLTLNLVKSPSWTKVPPERYGDVWDEVVIEYGRMDKKDLIRARANAGRAALAATIGRGLAATAAQAQQDQNAARIKVARVQSGQLP